jgi:hypothetical protein
MSSESLGSIERFIKAFIIFQRDINKDTLDELVKFYENMLVCGGIFRDKDNDTYINILEELRMIYEFPKGSEFYIPYSLTELQKILVNAFFSPYPVKGKRHMPVDSLNSIVIRNWKTEKLEEFSRVANNIIKNSKQKEILICARRLTPFDPQVIAEKIKDGSVIKILLVYEGSHKDQKFIKSEAISKIRDIFNLTPRYLHKNIKVRHSNIGDQLRFLLVGNVVILVVGSIHRINYDAIIIEDDRFSEIIRETFNNNFEKGDDIHVNDMPLRRNPFQD